MVYPADPVLPPLAEPPGCCSVPPDVIITLTIDRGYLPDPPPNQPEVQVLTGYSGTFSYFGDVYNYTLDPDTNTLTVTLPCCECFTGMTLISTGATLFGPYPPAYNQADGCTLGTGWLNMTDVSVAAAP